MKKPHFIGVLCGALFAIITVPANAAFFGRLETSPGSRIFQAYYDDQLDITWTADANINGSTNLGAQVEWAASLMIDGVDGWRLPSMDVNNDNVVVSCSSGNQATCKDNEYAHLFYYGAGTIRGEGITALNPSPFSDIGVDDSFLKSSYWSDTLFPGFPVSGWIFDFDSGAQQGLENEDTLLGNYAWAVRSGDISAVPAPAAIWLFGSGMLGFLGLAKRKAN